MNVVPISKPKPWLIDLLADLLDRAEQGEIRSFAYCAEKQAGEIEVGFTPFTDRMMVVAELERVKFQILTQLNEDGRMTETDYGY